MQMTPEDCYLEGEMAYISDDIEGARRAFKRAVDAEPNNAEFLDGYGAFLAECGPTEEAIAVLQQACELSPEHGFEKFMYLGQVLDRCDRTSEAEAAMRHGIEILRDELSSIGEAMENIETEEDMAPTRTALKEALCSALCSLAELLMGAAAEAADDADNEEGVALAASPALVECESLLGEARETWGKSPEPLQALCSLRKLQGRDDDALVLLRQSLALWHRSHPEEDNDDEEADDDDDDDVMDDDVPSYEFRFECARLMLELEESSDMAATLLEELVEENDGVPDVWLLLAVAYRSGGELEAAAEAAKEGVAVAKKLGLPSDHEVSAALEELAAELSSV